MQTRRIVAVLFAAVLLMVCSHSLADAYIFPIMPATPTAADISMAEAIMVAKNEMMKREELSEEHMQDYTIKANFVLLENNEHAWFIMLDNEEMLYDTDAMLTISSANAAILDYQATDMELTTILINLWKERKGPMPTWSLEDKALFDFLYGDSGEYVIPGEDHISREDASEAALAALPHAIASPGFSYRFTLLSYTDGRPDEYVWMVTILADGKEMYLVHVSAMDGTVIDAFALDGLG